MVYRVIGLMSGSSLDGLDIAHVQLEEVRGKWGFSILHADCVPYSDEWVTTLRNAPDMKAVDFVKLDTAYGRYVGQQVKDFMARYDLEHQVHFIVSHGHTVFHEPKNNTTCQIGDGAAIAALVGLPVISDLRAMDVALGGQGAPIVPIGDKLLFGDYDYLLNIGGIANITIQGNDAGPLAYDVCPANQILNALAEREGKPMDENGTMAEVGTMVNEVATKLDADGYYRLPAPKSLSNEAARNIGMPVLMDRSQNTYDLLHTMTQHIATRVAQSVQLHPHEKGQAMMLVTGGGAFNTFLITELQKSLTPFNVTVVVPEAAIVQYKEALVMALIGALRWREEANVLCSVTGAERDSVGGAVWLP